MINRLFTTNCRNLLLLLLSCLWAFSIQAQTNWTKVADGKTARGEAFTFDYNGEMYCFHGYTTGIKFVNDGEKYNPNTRTWTKLAPMPNDLGTTHSGIAFVGDRVMVIGGRVGENPGPVTSDVWYYIINEDRWVEGPDLPFPAGGGGVGRLGNKIHYVGGFNTDATCDINVHLVYDLDNPGAGWQDITSSAPFPSPRNHFSTVVVRGKLYVIGGREGHDNPRCPQIERIRNVPFCHVYDPADNSWRKLPNFPNADSHMEPASFVKDNLIFVLGGQNVRDEVKIFNVDTEQWSAPSSLDLPEDKFGASARIFGQTFVVGFGGRAGAHDPVSTTYHKTYNRTPLKELGFNPRNLTVNLGNNQQKSVETILYTMDGKPNFSINNLPAWLSVNKSSGKAFESSNEIVLTFDASKVSPGNYSHTVEAKANGYTTGKITVNMNVSSGGGDPNPDPTPNPGTCGSLPSPWLTSDIGAVNQAGEACFDNGTYTIKGAGDNLGGDDDEFFFTYQNFDCDGEMIARLDNIESGFNDAKVGIMIREQLADNAKMAIILVKPNDKAIFEYRTSTGGFSKNVKQDNQGVPRFLRIKRDGNTFTGYVSANGNNWNQVGSININMSQNVKIGFAVNSHEPGQLSSATFTNVQVSCEGANPQPDPDPDPTPDPTCNAAPNPWITTDVGGVGTAGSTCYDNGTFTLEASGENIGNSNDEFQFAYQDLDCNAEISAYIASMESGFPDAKVGVIMRESLTNNSKMAAVILKADGFAIFMRRTSTGSSVQVTRVGSRSVPRYVRLVRNGNTYSGYVSSNGTNWELLGSATFSMNQNLKVGLGFTSHENSTLAKAVFNQVNIQCNGRTPDPQPDPDPNPTCNAVPSPWITTDVGGVGTAGKTCYDNGTFTLEASGENIGNSNDEFQFAYQDLNCNAEISAYVASMESGFPDAKVGVIMRESLTNNSKMAAVILKADGFAIFMRRTSTGSRVQVTRVGSRSVPRYVRLVRNGNTYSGYVSSNGTSWELLGSATFSMNQNLKVGLGFTSHENSTLAEAVFEQVNVQCNGSTPTPDPEPEPTPGAYTFDVKLVDADTDEVFATPLSDGVNVNRGGMNKFNVAAENLPPGAVSVVFDIVSGPYTAQGNTENLAPFAMFGDNSGNFKGKNVNTNDTHRVKVKVFDGRSGSGNLLEEADITFTFVASGGTTLSQAAGLIAEANASAAITITHVAPNEVSQKNIEVELTRAIESQVVRFQVIDPLGRVIGFGTTTVEKPSTKLKLDLSGVKLDPGVFYLQLQGDKFATPPYRLVESK